MQILSTINTYWAIIAFFGGFIFHALWTYWKVADHGGRLDKLETKTDKHGELIQGVETHLASIDTSLKFIADSLKEKK